MIFFRQRVNDRPSCNPAVVEAGAKVMGFNCGATKELVLVLLAVVEVAVVGKTVGSKWSAKGIVVGGLEYCAALAEYRADATQVVGNVVLVGGGATRVACNAAGGKYVVQRLVGLKDKVGGVELRKCSVLLGGNLVAGAVGL